jgi:hypothetical protein
MEMSMNYRRLLVESGKKMYRSGNGSAYLLSYSFDGGNYIPVLDENITAMQEFIRKGGYGQ